MPQEGALFPHLSVAANVGFGLPGPASGAAARTDELLAAVGLTGMGGRYPHQLSGGQQQRVALARALAIRPEVVLLDEPFASLDAHMRASVRADVQRICRTAGTTAILVTHDQDEALSMADRIAVLRDGTHRAVRGAAGPLHPARRSRAGPLRRRREPARREAGRRARRDGGAGLRSRHHPRQAAAGAGQRAGRQLRCRHRAGAARAAGDHRGWLGGRAASGQPDCLAGHVVACEYYGHDAVVRVQPDGEPGGQDVIVRTAGGPQLPAGAPVYVRARGPVIAWARSA